MATSSTSDTLAGATEANEFGASMRDMRLAHKADLATVASTLRIRQVYLQAIEDGRFTDLPGPTYAAGFVRAYAEFLGLDLPEIMRRYREVALGSDRQAPLVAPSPVVEGTMPTGFILLVAAVLAATAYGSWYYLTLHGRDAGDIVAQIPQQIAEIVGLESDPSEASAAPSKPTIAPAPTKETDETDETEEAKEAEPDKPVKPEPAKVVEAEPPVRAQEPPAQAVRSPAPAQPERPAPRAAETSEGMISGRQAEPATTVISSRGTETRSAMTPSGETDAGTASLSGSPSVAETARNVATAARDAAGAVQQPAAAPEASRSSARSSDVRTTVIPAPAAPDVAIAAPVPDATRTAALPLSPPDADVPETASRVVLRATAISWVELRDVNGKRVFSRLLKKGETYNVPGRNGITLATGNAGALDVLVDGQTIGPLGPVGAVRRDVLLEPAALLRRGNARQ